MATFGYNITSLKALLNQVIEEPRPIELIGIFSPEFFFILAVFGNI